jgi:hypothetical protein
MVHSSDRPTSTHRPTAQTPSRISVAQSSPLGVASEVSSSSLGLASFQSPNISSPLNISSSLSSSSLSDIHKNAHNPTSPLPTSTRIGKQSTLGHNNSSKLSLPDSSQPSLNSDSSSMLPPPLPLRAPQSVASTSTLVNMPAESDRGLLGSLHETSALYNLSRADLENLVSRVVREEGFAELVCCLSGHNACLLNNSLLSLRIWIRCGE